MALIDEIVMVILVSVILCIISIVSFSFWSFLFAFLFAFPISTIIASKFAKGQKTMGSHGRYEKTSIVYLYFMVGIVVSSFLGSFVAESLVEILNPDNFMSVFFLSFFTSFIAYVLMKIGLY